MSNPLLDENTCLTVETAREKLLLFIGAFSQPDASWDHVPELLTGTSLQRLKLDLDTLSVLIGQRISQADFDPNPQDFAAISDQQCGDYPAPCNCDDPITHNSHNRNRD